MPLPAEHPLTVYGISEYDQLDASGFRPDPHELLLALQVIYNERIVPMHERLAELADTAPMESQEP